jgi:LacI family repressor for deo operon, udp, cdd, tsx, nupC, and nupG
VAAARVSIKDIARIAGVSHSTVSRALSDSSLVREETKARIRRLAEEMGYSPSAIARGLVTQRTRTIGLVVTSIADPFWAEVVGGVEEAALDYGYNIILANSNSERQREITAVKTLREKRVDGIIVAASRVGALYRPMLEELGAPIVLVNSHSEEEESYIYSIATDNVRGGRLATEHLLRLGHRRIGYIADPEDLGSNSDRLQGYQQALSAWERDLDPALIVNGDGNLEGGQRAMHQLLSLSNPPTGVFCYNDLTAIGALHAARQRGLRMPEDISVVGYDDLAIAAYTTPPLTTVAQAKREMGRKATEMVLSLLSENPSAANIVLQGELIVRESTGPVPGRQVDIELPHGVGKKTKNSLNPLRR